MLIQLFQILCIHGHSVYLGALPQALTHLAAFHLPRSEACPNGSEVSDFLVFPSPRPLRYRTVCSRRVPEPYEGGVSVCIT
jgi:hypothetical protein